MVCLLKRVIKEDGKFVILMIPLIVIIILIAYMYIDLIPVFQKIMENKQNESVMVNYIDSYGIKGVFIIICLQVFQVASLVLPAMPVQVLAGLCYGIVYGTIISIIGFSAGHIIIFLLARNLGNILMPLYRTREFKYKNKYINVNIIRKSRRPMLLAFLLYIIPGIPNGILPYIFSKSDITTGEFLFSVILAGIPGILISTVLGSRLSKGDFLSALLLLLFCVIIVFIVVVFRAKINKKIEKMD